MSEIATTPNALLNAVANGTTYVQLLNKVLAEADKQVEPEKKGRSTIATRKAALVDAVKTLDAEVLVPLQDQMQNYIDTMSKVEMAEPRTLTTAESTELMDEYLKYQPISEFLDTRKEFIRTMVLTSIDQAIEEKGQDPTNTNGRIDVASLNKSFRKEGAGYAAPGLNQKMLAELLGDDAEKVFTIEEVPATTKVVFDEEALMKLAAEKPEVMEHIRTSLIPGKAKTARFTVRKYEAKPK